MFVGQLGFLLIWVYFLPVWARLLWSWLHLLMHLLWISSGLGAECSRMVSSRTTQVSSMCLPLPSTRVVQLSSQVSSRNQDKRDKKYQDKRASLGQGSKRKLVCLSWGRQRCKRGHWNIQILFQPLPVSHLQTSHWPQDAMWPSPASE